MGIEPIRQFRERPYQERQYMMNMALRVFLESERGHCRNLLQCVPERTSYKVKDNTKNEGTA